jgi:hypothetical protein
MSLASLSGHTASQARVAWPAWGLWWADVDTPEPVELSGRVALDVAATSFSGTIVAGGAFDGRAAYRLVAGAGGVNKALPKKSYVNDAGVALANVLGDAAREAGEALTGAPSTRLGSHYARKEGETFGDLLQRHCPSGWYADTDGTIRIGTRAATTYDGTALRVRVDPRGAVIDLAVDSLAGLAPGVQVDGSGPASDLQVDLTTDRLTVRVYSASPTTERLEAYADIIRAVFPSLAYLGVWEYRVVTQSAERLNLQPARVASGMPDLRAVPVRPGVSGVKAVVTPGELVLVCFADGDPSRPQVFAHDHADAPGWMPIAFQIGGPAALPVAYQGSAVVAGPFGGTVTLGSTLAKVRP